MILNCPNCQVKYDIPSAYFAQGQRRVRCSNCSFEWEHRDPDSERHHQSGAYRDADNPPNHDDAETGDEFGFLTAVDDDSGKAAFAGTQLAMNASLDSAPGAQRLRAAVLMALGAAVLFMALYFWSNAITTVAPWSAGLYRLVQIEPAFALKDWEACVVQTQSRNLSNGKTQTTATLQVTNGSGLGRLRPDISVEGMQATWIGTGTGAVSGGSLFFDAGVTKRVEVLTTVQTIAKAAPVSRPAQASHASIGLLEAKMC